MAKELEIESLAPLNQTLRIEVRGEKGPGGAYHRYEVLGFDPVTNPAASDEHGNTVTRCSLPIIFQHGTTEENGANGVTEQVLLSIVADRLRSFQTGDFPCEENKNALLAVKEALNALKERERDRMSRGVEGKHLP